MAKAADLMGIDDSITKNVGDVMVVGARRHDHTPATAMRNSQPSTAKRAAVKDAAGSSRTSTAQSANNQA